MLHLSERRKFHDKYQEVSNELLHDLARIYVRPANFHTTQWLEEAFTKIYSFLRDRVPTPKPIYSIFEVGLLRGSSDRRLKWDDENIALELDSVIYGERRYGLIINASNREFIGLYKKLYNLLRNSKPDERVNLVDKANSVISAWYRSIPGSDSSKVKQLELR